MYTGLQWRREPSHGEAHDKTVWYRILINGENNGFITKHREKEYVFFYTAQKQTIPLKTSQLKEAKQKALEILMDKYHDEMNFCKEMYEIIRGHMEGTLK